MGSPELAVFGVIFLALGLPLQYELVPRNGIYGLRTSLSRQGDAEWYAANRTAGRVLALWGAALIALAAIAAMVGASALYAVLAAAGSGVAVLLGLVLGVRDARRVAGLR